MELCGKRIQDGNKIWHVAQAQILACGWWVVALGPPVTTKTVRGIGVSSHGIGFWESPSSFPYEYEPITVK